MDNCALCRKAAELRESHILPSFVFRWSKATSITGYLRFGNNPRRRVQDGLKVPLLCASCEAMLSGWETRFATDVFHPYNADTAVRASYGEWMLKFCVSVSWRVLTYFTKENGLEDWSPAQQAAAVAALDRWRAFLFGEVADPGPFEQNLLPLDVISDSTVPDMPPYMNRYLARSIDMDLARCNETAFVYSKMGKFALFGMVVPTARWDGARVHVRRGAVRPGKFVVPHQVAGYLADRARGVAKLTMMIPEHQADKHEEIIEREPERVANSDQFASMLADAKMFGWDSIIRKRPKG